MTQTKRRPFNRAENLVWDVPSLSWVPETQPGGVGGGGTQYTEDVASVADPIGNQLIARRRDTLASETTTDGDVTALNSTAKGELYVKQTDVVPIVTGISIPTWDYVSNVSGATTDTYTFKSGGAGGSTVATVTVTFTDATKATLSTVVKT